MSKVLSPFPLINLYEHYISKIHELCFTNFCNEFFCSVPLNLCFHLSAYQCWNVKGSWFTIVFQGPASKSGTCATCHGSFTACPGHFGYLNLALPVFNVGYFNAILDILKCICKVLNNSILVFFLKIISVICFSSKLFII